MTDNTGSLNDNSPNTETEHNTPDTLAGSTIPFARQSFTPGLIVSIDITDELKRDYLDYAMSVIMARALPDVRDGLKPSQRRLIVSMKDLQLHPNKNYKKSAKIVGETMGKYHPHGDQAIYMTLVHMAQPFAFRYPLVDGQGNFGSIDGDPPAQMRYTEARMAKITTQLIRDLDKGLVTFIKNYDGSELEPTVLPAHLPTLFMNGSEGIAVGMATKIPPHNLGELIDALVAIIEAGNAWQGKAIYNTLRKLKERFSKTPALYNSKPTDELENYVHPEDPNKQIKLDFYRKLLNTKSFNVELAKSTFSEKDIEELQQALFSISVDTDQPVIITNDITLYPKIKTNLTTKKLMQHIKGPDFPTAGVIYNKKDIFDMYETGKGKVLVRGVAKVEESKRGKTSIVITEIPYQVNKAVLIQTIAKLIQNKKIRGVRDIRDESNKEGIRVVLELKGSANPQVIINKLFKYTPLQIKFHANMIALVDKQPITLNLKQYLELFLEFRLQLEIRRLEFEIAEAKYRNHILEGLLKALDIIDEIIATIKASKTQEQAKTNLMSKFDFTELQAQAILDMPLKRLTSLEREKLLNEYKDLKQLITHHESHLEDPNLILQLIKTDLINLKEQYADPRRTKIVPGTPEEPEEHELVQEEDVVVTITNKGYVKRTPITAYRMQRRGGVGTKTARLANDDFIKQNLLVNTKDTLLVFTDKGYVFKLNVYEIPEASRQSKGVHVANLMAVSGDTKISKVLPIKRNLNVEDYYLTFLTQNGLIKRTHLTEYANIRQNGLKAIILKEDDALQDVILSKSKQDVLISTKLGKGIRFNISQVRPMSRASRGVTGIKLSSNDKTISLEVIDSNKDLLLTLTSKGYMKLTPITEIRKQKRSGKGIKIHSISEKKGVLVEAKIIPPFDTTNAPEVIITTKQGNTIRINLSKIPTQSRYATGVRVMKVAENDEVIGISI